MVNRLVDRRGKSNIGCLGTLALLVAGAYLAAQFLPPLMHYEQFLDSMRSNAQFATTLTDSSIRDRLMAQADSLGLPPEAKKVVVLRRKGDPPTITISTEYTERVYLPIFGVKLLHFAPKVEESL